MRGNRSWKLLLALLAVLGLLAAACGDSDDDSSDDTEAPSDDTEAPSDDTEAPSDDTEAPSDDTEAPADGDTEAPAEGDGEPFSVAFVSPSAINDLAFTQTIYDAMIELQGIYGEDNFEFVYSDGLFVVEDAAAALRGYAEDGHDLVIAHGSQYGGSLQEIAPDFPETAFMWGPALDTFGLDNVSAYDAAADEGGYVLGAMAAAVTETGTIGIVGPVEAGEPIKFIDAFIAGVGDEADATAVYTGSFSDVALASEAANSFISNGADVLTGTSQAMVGAIGAAQEAGAYWFSTQSNQAELAPESVVASQVYQWEVVLEPMIDAIMSGTLGGETAIITLENGGLEMQFNDGVALDDQDTIRTIMDDTVAGIVAGEIDTGA